jgi:amino acid efflux transporter
MNERGNLGVLRGSALYVGALIGPGILLVPALAAQAAGAASIIAWAGLLVLSAPLAITFAALGVRHPVAGGVSAYVREGFGDAAGAVTGAWFLCAVLLGGPAVSLIGGYYVADLTGSGTFVATLVGLAMFGTVIGANMLGLRVSSGFQLGLASVLVVVMAVAITVALPSRGGHNWTPFAPHGWSAIGTAGTVLMLSFVGWEAIAPMTARLRDAERQLPRVIALAFSITSAIYLALAVAVVGTLGARAGSATPVADLLRIAIGPVGAVVAAIAAVALTLAATNAYLCGAAELAAELVGPRGRRGLPPVVAVVGVVLLVPVAVGWVSTAQLVVLPTTLFVAVYVAATAAGVRLLSGSARLAAALSCAAVGVVLAFAGTAVALPVLVGAVAGWSARRRSSRATDQLTPCG